MNNSEMIRELRALTQAGMKDCKDALEESGWDLQKAVDIVKVKGLNVVDGRSGKVASEGCIMITQSARHMAPVAMVEVNCQTDFVANSHPFRSFANKVSLVVVGKHEAGQLFSASDVEDQRKELVSTTKENVVVRRWWIQEPLSPKAEVFSYLHSNLKIGVLLTLNYDGPGEWPTDGTATQEFSNMGNDLAMQVAAMNPVAVSSIDIPEDVLARQKAIFDTQLKEMNKTPAAQVKILEGKFRKWYTEVCLLEQESVVVPKTTVGQLLKNLSAKLGGEVSVVNFVRAQVGEGIEVQKENYTDEISKLTGVASEKPTGYAV